MVVVERSVSFKRGESERMMPITGSPLEREKDASTKSVNINSKELDYQSLNLDNHSIKMIRKLGIFYPISPKHQAAVKLQKVYKSYRTRKMLADCAVLVEQNWWELLDFAELKWISISFFDIKKHHVPFLDGHERKGEQAELEKACQMMTMHKNLLISTGLKRSIHDIDMDITYISIMRDGLILKADNPSFTGKLDIGEGKEVNLEACPRSKFQKQCIKYLGPTERKAYEAVIEEGKLLYKKTGELIHTTADAKSIFVLDTSKTLYVGKKKKGTFQHSSFLAGGVTTAAGRLIVESGILKAIWPHSGHYWPTEEKFQDFLSFLRENNVDLTDVETSSLDEEDSMLCNQRRSDCFRSSSGDGTAKH